MISGQHTAWLPKKNKEGGMPLPWLSCFFLLGRARTCNEACVKSWHNKQVILQFPSPEIRTIVQVSWILMSSAGPAPSATKHSPQQPILPWCHLTPAPKHAAACLLFHSLQCHLQVWAQSRGLHQVGLVGLQWGRFSGSSHWVPGLLGSSLHL